MRIPIRFVTAVAVMLAVACLALAVGAGPPVAAQSTYNAGLSVTVRAEPGDASPGQAVLLAVAVTNESAWPIHLDLVCDPPFDLQVRDSGGTLVWQRHATCAAATSRIQLAPGQRQEWTALWNLVDGAGNPVARALYGVWGTVATTPLTSVAGPLWIEAGGGPAQPHPEPSATPMEHPEPTHTPAEHHPEPTDTPGGHPHPTERPEPTDVPTEVPTEEIEERPAFPITDREGRQRMPDVAGDPSVEDCQNLVVWWDETAKQIWGRFVEPEWRGEPFLISGEARADGPPSVSFNRERRRWFVVWRADTYANRGEIWGRYVDCGDLEGPPFHIASDPMNDDQPAALAFGTTFGVVWRRSSDATGSKIYGAQIVGLDTRHVTQISGGDGHALEPAAACEPNEPCLVVWTRVVGDSRDVVGRYWFPHEAYHGEKLLEIATTERRERYPAVAWNGEVDTYLVTWTDEGGDRATVRARAVHPTAPRSLDDYVVGQHTMQVSPSGRDADHGDVAAIGHDFVVVWAEGDGQIQDIASRRVSVPRDTHAPSGHATVSVSQADPAERYPAVASAGDPLALAVWETEWPNGGIDIMGRHYVVPRSGGGVLIVLRGEVTAQSVVDGGGHWDMGVGEVLAGTFACNEAHIYYDDSNPVATPVDVGDEVTVSGQALPAPYECALVADSTDVGGGRVPVARLFLPMGAH